MHSNLANTELLKLKGEKKIGANATTFVTYEKKILFYATSIDPTTICSQMVIEIELGISWELLTIRES